MPLIASLARRLWLLLFALGIFRASAEDVGRNEQSGEPRNLCADSKDFDVGISRSDFRNSRGSSRARAGAGTAAGARSYSSRWSSSRSSRQTRRRGHGARAHRGPWHHRGARERHQRREPARAASGPTLTGDVLNASARAFPAQTGAPQLEKPFTAERRVLLRDGLTGRGETGARSPSRPRDRRSRPLRRPLRLDPGLITRRSPPLRGPSGISQSRFAGPPHFRADAVTRQTRARCRLE